jgi:hypothetical protein
MSGILVRRTDLARRFPRLVKVIVELPTDTVITLNRETNTRVCDRRITCIRRREALSRPHPAGQVFIISNAIVELYYRTLVRQSQYDTDNWPFRVKNANGHENAGR